MRLTERDTKIVEKLQACKCLTTSQVARFFFPGSTLSAVRQRLKKLAKAKLIRSYRANRMAEAYHSTEKRSIKQIEHICGTNEVRVAVETSGLKISYFYAYWELPSMGWDYPAIPDAIFSIEKDGKRYRFIVEYDRSTESSQYLCQKILLYDDWGFEFDKVLILCDTKARVKGISNSLSHSDKDYYEILLLVDFGKLLH